MKRIFAAILVVAGVILIPAVGPSAGPVSHAGVAIAGSTPSLTGEVFQAATLSVTNNSNNGGSACPTSASGTPSLTICRTDQAVGGATCDTTFNSTSMYEFAATGTAKGPVNGTYTENGAFQIQYDGSGNPTLAAFNASFQISSGSGTVASGSLGLQPADSNGQYTSTPDALLTGYCNGFGAPVIEALVTFYNAQVNGSGVTGQTDIQLTGTAGTAGPSSDGFQQNFNWTATTGVCYTSIDSSFNTTAIPAGDTLYLPAVFKLQGPKPSSPVTFNFNAQQVTFPGGTSYAIPNGTITVSPTATTATTTYANGAWQTTVPAGYAGNTFAAAVAIPMPNGLTGGQKPVTWSAQITSSATGYTVHWQWSGAVYTSFPTDNSETVAPVDGTYKAGTPTNETQFLTAGATGTGGTSYTGSPSSTAHCAF